MVDRRQSTSSLSLLQRRFTGLSVSRKSSEPTEEIRGPLGLNLLYEPPEPLIDFVFVHGLRGGSRKTWSKTANVAHYWPQEWLPLEPEFRNVRIHSFGYNSDWGERKGSALTVHDFGQALIGDLSTSPHLSRQRTPLVLIGHSMGGIVIKKAFLLAKRDPSLHSLASRFQSIFFLATPHRGADSAQMLENMIRVSAAVSMKAYVGDLKPNSGTIQSINDEFRHVYQPTQLWSFFETVATSLGIIVEKDSAVIGLPNENVHLLNADHRHVCKFEDPSDDNYRTLRNAFVSTIDTIDQTWYSSRKDDHRNAMKCLSEYLRIGERPETDLADVSDKRADGSCLWLTDNDSFQAWQEGLADAPKVFWLTGEPGTGKSVLAGHVVNYLADCGGDCSYFFFKYGDATRSTVSGLLRSLAWQMAFTNTTIRNHVLEMQRSGETIDHSDERGLWRTLFVSKIFQLQIRQPCYWIIDALDECSNIASLLPLISRADKNFPLHIFVTSRPSSALDIQFQSEKISKAAMSTSQATSFSDIRLFVESHKHFLPVEDHDARALEDLVNDLTQKSNGNFLWASLVVQELATANSEAQVREILRAVPTEMDKFYQRILDNLLATPRNLPLAKAILRWTVCAARPLTTDELKEAIKNDIAEVVPQLEKKAGAICGHLVFVDKDLRVRVTHATVRTYLMGGHSSTSEFYISRVKEHSRLAKVCLSYLSGPEMKPPKFRPGRVVSRHATRSAFAEYAIANFAEHIARATSEEDAHLLALNAFLQTHVLTWIEAIATSQDLRPLIQTTKQLKNYMERRAKYIPPLGVEIQNVSSWITDLVHIIAEFGKPLLAAPSSIHFLIPPLCPAQSMVYQASQLNNRGFRVAGLSQKTWDDRLSCIVTPGTKVLSISCGDHRFALGLQDKTARIYDNTTFQDDLQIDSGEPVRAIKLATTRSCVVVASRKTVQLYDTTDATLMWRAAIPAQTLAIEFNEDESQVYVVTQANTMSIWNVTNGVLLDTFRFKDTDEDEQDDYYYQRPATFGAISPSLGLLAVAYRQRPVTFWDLEDNSFIGQFHKANSSYPWPLIVSLLFNPQPDIRLAAVAYHGGDIVVLDPCTMMQQATVTAEASILAASPDGTILAAAHGSSGGISLYDFETLKLVYRLNSYEEDIKMMAFASNSLRFFDIRGEQCNVWEPSKTRRQRG